MTTKNLPPVDTDYVTWINALIQMPPGETYNLHEYKALGGKNERMWLINAGQYTTSGLQAKLLKVELTNINDERINCYSLTDEARVYFKNGHEQNLTPQEMIDGWMAMQSMMAEVPETEAGSSS